jgi:hypothetical protein
MDVQGITREAYNQRPMNHFAEIVLGLLFLVIFHLVFNVGMRKVGRGLGKLVGAGMRPALRTVLTAHYRRKVTKEMQEKRKTEGVPPLENPRLD